MLFCVYISSDGNCGLRICLILLPTSDGLNGAYDPYGLGSGSSLSPSGI